jgi:hypothetical protein
VRVGAWCKIGVLVLSVFLSSAGLLKAKQTNPPSTAQQHTDFFVLLEGIWEGQARVTPIGPRPYDMTYVQTAPRRVEGQAHPGVSTHYWTFYEEGDTLTLRFLSTFAGNQHPFFLTALQEHQGTFVFHAPQPGFLEVHVTLQANTLTKKIFLRGKPHVEIHLLRRLPNRGSAGKDDPTP